MPAAQILLVVGLLFAKTVYQELDVDSEMQHGLLPGSLALAAKFVPTMKQVLLLAHAPACVHAKMACLHHEAGAHPGSCTCMCM